MGLPGYWKRQSLMDVSYDQWMYEQKKLEWEREKAQVLEKAQVACRICTKGAPHTHELPLEADPLQSYMKQSVLADFAQKQIRLKETIETSKMNAQSFLEAYNQTLVHQPYSSGVACMCTSCDTFKDRKNAYRKKVTVEDTCAICDILTSQWQTFEVREPSCTLVVCDTCYRHLTSSKPPSLALDYRVKKAMRNYQCQIWHLVLLAPAVLLPLFWLVWFLR
jgi:hypothetical protein